MDEASQITLPVTLGPLKRAQRFVLVGDHYQLPPLMRSTEARNSGMSSLFKYLSESHPEAVSHLKFQYRMNKDIMKISNQLIYNFKLRCGTEYAKELVLDIPNIHALDEVHKLSSQINRNIICPDDENCWIRYSLNPKNSVIFLDTDNIPLSEVHKSDLVQNELETEIIYQLVQSLTMCGVSNSSIGIISPYRAQIKLLHSCFRGMKKDLEIHTVDKFQGKDKDCIIVSLVRSNRDGNIGILLRDWRRVNVTFTRAKKKLIVVGSVSTLEKCALFEEFFQIFRSNNWIYKIPENFKDNHKFKLSQDTFDSYESRQSNIENTQWNNNSNHSSYLEEKQRNIRQSQAKVLIKNSPLIKNIIEEY